jgi:ComF family protein
MRKKMGLIADTFDLLYPRSCEVCGKNRPEALSYLCWECHADIMPVQPPYCSLCGDPVSGRIDYSYICHFCSSTKPDFSLARSAVHYEGPVAEMLKALKYRGAIWLVPDLASLLYSLVIQHLDVDKIDAITFVPLYHSRCREREYNQAALLARQLARITGRPYMNRILIRHRKTPTQTNLTAAQRISNVKGSFKYRNKSWLEGRRILLVDDVMTTGATVNECAKTLKKGGVQCVYVVAVARGIK